MGTGSVSFKQGREKKGAFSSRHTIEDIKDAKSLEIYVWAPDIYHFLAKNINAIKKQIT